MEKKLTLHDVITAVNNGFAAMGRSMENLSIRTNAIESRMAAFETRMTAFETRMDALEGRMISLENRSESIERKIYVADGRLIGLESQVRIMDTKVSRIELVSRNTQENLENFHQEMRGVHKVIDGFNGRILKVEKKIHLAPGNA